MSRPPLRPPPAPSELFEILTPPNARELAEAQAQDPPPEPPLLRYTEPATVPGGVQTHPVML